MKPRPNAAVDDEAIAEMIQWLKTNRMVALTRLSGRMTLIPAEEFYNIDGEFHPVDPRQET